MIERYSTPEMAELWSEQSKFSYWLKVELAVIQAKVEMGILSQDISQRISAQADFSLKRIEGLEAELKHDLLAFVGSVQENLDPDLRKYFHADITSYDTEEPAMALMLIKSMQLIFKELDELKKVLFERAKQHKYLIKIQRTHGQHAQPSTVGLEFLFWYDALNRQGSYLGLVGCWLSDSKLSGAVGTYEGKLSPELETRSLDILGLDPAPISMQIILRDRHAHLMNTLAVLAGVLENIALNIQIMGQTEICEYQEPFGKKQKGSSIMPHKKNTILSENLRGLARIARHNAGITMENIPTWSARDISHSSAERVVFPDMFNLLHFMLRRTKKLIEGLIVNERNIEQNLYSTQGRVFSPDVKELLMQEGFDPEQAYRITQEAAFESFEKQQGFLDVLLERDDLSQVVRKSLKQLFNTGEKVRYIDDIFARFE